MVFSSINPLYLDPHNWQQQQQSHQQGTGGSTGNHDQFPVLPPPSSMGGGAGSTGSIRPGSMVDRARLANLPQPEPGLKCPRCESTNTKFCYFNNYNLAQPRHFCKTCRRYWTRGGALRSVPVGGGCRRNKRSTKSNNNNGTTSKSTSLTSSSTSTDVVPTHFPQMPLMPSSQNLGNTSLSTTTHQFGASRNNLGLNFGGAQQECDLGFIQLGSNSNINSSSTILSNSQWRNPQHAQHFPFLTTSFEPNATANTSFYQLFHNEDHQNVVDNVPSSNPLSESMKMEDQSPLGLNLTKSLLGGGSENMSQYWGNGGNAWNDFSGTGLNSSSSNNLL